MFAQSLTAGGTVSRFDAAALADAIGRLGEAGLIDGGGVVVVNLEAVRVALAERWDAKREQVWEHVERSLTRELGPATIAVRAGETDFLVAQPGVERPAAHGGVLRALKEILAFFLGQVRPQDLRLQQVDGVDGGALICRPLDPAGGEDIVVTARAGQAAAQPSAPAFSYSVFAAVDGAVLRVTCAYDDLVALKNGGPAGYRLRPCVSDVSGPNRLSVRTASLDWRDAERVDSAVLQQAIGLLASLPPRAGVCLAPVSFATLSSQRGRRSLFELVEALASGTRRIVFEIRDLKGVPASRLTEVVGLVRPLVYGLVGEVEADRTQIAGLAGCGLNGLSIRTLADWARDPRLVDHFQSAAALARRIAPFCLARAPAAERLPVIRDAGYTHGYLPPACGVATATAA